MDIVKEIREAVDYAFGCTIATHKEAEPQLLGLAMRHLNGKANPTAVLNEIRRRLVPSHTEE